MAVCFLVQIKHDNNAWDKGVVVKEAETQEAAENAAKQGYHAYFGAYGYDNKATCDYVQCMVVTDDGRVVKSEVDDRREEAEG